MVKILLLCSGGFSSSLLVSKMNQLAKEQGEELEVFSTGTEALEELISQYEIILVAPQVRHRFSRLSEIAGRYNRPIALIDPLVFGRIEAEKVLFQAKELLAAGEKL